jgi:hypothetical protein
VDASRLAYSAGHQSWLVRCDVMGGTLAGLGAGCPQEAAVDGGCLPRTRSRAQGHFELDDLGRP